MSVSCFVDLNQLNSMLRTSNNGGPNQHDAGKTFLVNESEIEIKQTKRETSFFLQFYIVAVRVERCLVVILF